ncbi:NIPSNAP family protein [Sphingomonas sp.]|uniref:NIPSNAP family protein n=1 Tax=Sphingomonas sp. TaxID=28214 RepID=UPI002C35BC6A|nr:NIPSNAP family protein [Sphingomonas sp.]HTG39204.1 NIPSNAP family protein [Sphingomonas sp.]
MILKPLLLAPLACLTIAAAAPAQDALDPQAAFYELRIYYPAPGKLAALNKRFREHTLALFARHGMKNVAYWNEQPTEAAPEGRIVYVLAYPDRAARERSWKAFGNDPEWRAVAAASEADGKLVAKVDSVFMTMADYSPPLTLQR